jgi:predicted site-specific integrase-resolvase
VFLAEWTRKRRSLKRLRAVVIENPFMNWVSEYPWNLNRTHLRIQYSFFVISPSTLDLSERKSLVNSPFKFLAEWTRKRRSLKRLRAVVIENPFMNWVSEYPKRVFYNYSPQSFQTSTFSCSFRKKLESNTPKDTIFVFRDIADELGIGVPLIICLN